MCEGDEASSSLAAAKLGEAKDLRAVPLLVECLNNPKSDPYVRVNAAVAMGKLEDRRAVVPLINHLNDRPDVANAVATALGRIRDKRAVSPLAKALKDNDLATAAAAALGDIGTDDAVAVLISEMWDEGLNADVAIEALGSTDNPRAIDALNEFALKGKQLPNRYDAIGALKGRLDSAIIDMLIRALTDKADQQHKYAAQLLAPANDLRAVDPLIVCLDDQACDIKANAAGTIGELLDGTAAREQTAPWRTRRMEIADKATVSLQRVLRDRDHQVQISAIEAIGKIHRNSRRDSEVSFAVLDLLQEDDPEVKHAAIVALTTIGAPSAVPSMLKVAEEDPTLRQTLVIYLDQSTDSRAVPFLVRRLSDGGPDMQGWALHDLEEIGDPRALKPILSVIEPADTERVIEGYGEGAPLSESTVPAWIDLLDDGRPKVRTLAAKRLEQASGSPAVREALAAHLDDPDPLVEAQVASGLAQAEDARAIAPLTSLSDSGKDMKVRLTAVTGLGHFASSHPEAADAIIRRFTDSETAVQARALESASHNWVSTNASDQRNTLRRLVTDGRDESVRFRALLHLWQLGDPELFELLIGRLQDPSPGVQAEAARFLTDGDARAIGPLAAIVDDTHPPDVRLAATIALGAYEDTRAEPLLERRVNDPDPDVRQAALEALERLGDPGSLKVVVEALSKANGTVRSQAVRTLATLYDDNAIRETFRVIETDDPTPLDADGFVSGDLADRMISPPDVLHLQQLMGSKKANIRARAAGVLTWQFNPEVKDTMVDHLSDPDPRVSAVAADVLNDLSKLDKEESGDEVRTGGTSQHEKDPSERASATAGIAADASDDRTVDELITEAGSSDYKIAVPAIKRLGKLRSTKAVDQLLTKLWEPDTSAWEPSTSVRRATVISLTEIGDARAAKSLSKYRRERGGGEVSGKEWMKALAATNALDELGALDWMPENHKFKLAALQSASGYQTRLLTLVHSISATENYAARLELLGVLRTWEGPQSRVTGSRLDGDVFALGKEGTARDPYLEYFVSRLHLANGRDADALKWAERGLQHVTEKDVSLTLEFEFLRAEALYNQQQIRAALPHLVDAQAHLWPKVREIEERRIDDSLKGRTLLFKGLALRDLKRGAEAELALADAKVTVLSAKRRKVMWEETADRLLDAIDGHLFSVREAETKKDAFRVVGHYEERPPVGKLEEAAQRAALIAAFRIAAEADAANANDKTHRDVQQLAEKLALLDVPAPREVTLANPQSNQAYRELRELQERRDAAVRASDEADAELRRSKEAAIGKVQSVNTGSSNADRSLADVAADLAAKKVLSIKELNTFLWRLQEQYPYLAARFGARPLELEAIQRRLGSEQRLIQYVLLEDKAYAIVVSRDELHTVPLLNVRQSDVATMKDRMVALIQAEVPEVPLPTSEPVDEDKPAVRLASARELLSRWFIYPLLDQHFLGKEVGEVTSLVIVPSGPLYQLPFAALPLRDGKDLVDRFDIRILNTDSTIAAVTRPISIDDDRPHRFVAFANPTRSDGRPLPGLGSLEGATEEVESIKKTYFPGAEYHLGPDALRKWLVDQPLNGAILHLALHAKLGTLDQTSLIFSDGAASVSDVAHLSLEGSPVVVVSACETARGKDLGGGEVASLSEAFIIAGAQGVVGTLWAVPDLGSSGLMLRFYSERHRGNAVALAIAQRDSISKGAVPAKWAAYTVTGW
jgi:HEAT repeat protein/CHAT domain-containing protein